MYCAQRIDEKAVYVNFQFHELGHFNGFSSFFHAGGVKVDKREDLEEALDGGQVLVVDGLVELPVHDPAHLLAPGKMSIIRQSECPPVF